MLRGRPKSSLHVTIAERETLHRVESLPGLRDWLAESDAAVGEEARAELILCECGSAAKTWAKDWRAARPRFELHVAPRGALWFETIDGWFAPQAPGMARVHELLGEAIASGDRFEGQAGSYGWSVAGERVIRAAADFLR